jgi:hypothetical protein
MKLALEIILTIVGILIMLTGAFLWKQGSLAILLTATGGLIAVENVVLAAVHAAGNQF